MNYLKVCKSVIILTVVYPVGTGKSVCAGAGLGYGESETDASGCLRHLPPGRDFGALP